MQYLRLLLFPFSLLYGFILRVRNWLYDNGILESWSPPLPVICIGNLNIGGSGKTPHTEYLIRLLKNHYKIAILSRGYGRTTRGFRYLSPDCTALEAGDEPLQLFRKFGKEVLVAVDENRRKGIEKLIHDHPELELIILDDAYQHRRVKASLNILLTDYSQPFYTDLILPAGNLREPRSGWKRCDMLVVTKCPDVLTNVQEEAFRKAVPGKKVFFTAVRYEGPVLLSTGEPTEFPDDKPGILALSGIANSKPFETWLKTKTEELEVLEFPDHHIYSPSDLDKMRTQLNAMSKKSNIIATTEKDAIRLYQPSLSTYVEQLPIYYVPIAIEIRQDDKQSFEEFINRHVGESKRCG
ncbi:MAG TPA: tetraacyldisaccharide 4'-kinase [Bacteroidia bacterium]|nr:tetraacyldisaccharide 4'-kinase [Bacteroidia bacterium]